MIYMSIAVVLGLMMFDSHPNMIVARQNDQLDSLRIKMVDEQIVARGVSDLNVLNAMRKVQRHLFVPMIYRSYAYYDRPLPIGYDQTISQPFMVAYMTEVLKLKRSDKVLEIGTGSGYQAAILGEISDFVFSIEIIEALGMKTQKLLSELGYDQIQTKIADGYKGWIEHAPFDAIIVTCAPNDIPQPLQEQLAEGGRMIIPVGRQGAQKLILIRKKNGKLIEEAVMRVSFVPMLNQSGKKH